MRALSFVVLVAACSPSPPPSAPVTRVDVAPVGSSTPLVVEPAPAAVTPASASSASPPPSDGSFDKMKAATELAAVKVGMCAQPGGPTGPGHVTVTFDPNGRVSTAVVDSPPFAGTPVGGCIAAAFGTMHVPPFQGAPVRVGKSFAIP